MYLVDSLHRLLAHSQIHSSNFGWLLLSRRDDFFFLNPSTATIIQLPPVNEIKNYNRMGFSAPPTSLHCVVFGLVDMFDDTRKIYFSLLRRGDSSWIHFVGQTLGLDNTTKMEFISKRFVGPKLKSNRCQHPSIPCTAKFQWCCSSSPVFHNRAFYCLSKCGVLGVFTPDTKKKNNMWRLINTTMHKAFKVDVRDEPYLMESSKGELISVVVRARGESIRVFKLDENLNVWQNVSSLQDHAIFLSRTSCLMMHCDYLPVKGFRNTIHFPRFHGNNNIFYSLLTNKFHTLDGAYTSQDLSDTQLLLDSAWLVPDFSSSSIDDLDWSSSNIDESMFEGSDLLHPNYFIRNLTFLQPTGLSNRNILCGINNSCSVIEHEASAASQTWIMLHDDRDGGNEEVKCTLVDVFGGISYPMHHLGARLRGFKIYASGYGKLLMMDIPAGDCILLDISSMTICSLPMLEDYDDKYKTSVIYKSPRDSRIFVMFFGVIINKKDRKENGNEGDQNGDKEDIEDDDDDDDGNAQDNGEGDEEEEEDDHRSRVDKCATAFEDPFQSSLYFCQVGDDKWSALKFQGVKSKNVVLYNDKIYAIQTWALRTSVLAEIEMQPTYADETIDVLNHYLWRQRGSEKSKEYLVESCGELLIIQVVTDGYKPPIKVIMNIKVFRFDAKTKTIDELEDLGDRAIFISNNNGERCFGCCATKFGVKKNSIYLTYRGERHVYKYDYENDSVSSCPVIDSDMSLECLCWNGRLQTL
ncbi:F-box/kelch-repeat protein At1g57790 [Linum grandiflorum]